MDNGRIEIFRNNDTRITPNITTTFVNITNKQSDKATTDTKMLNAYLQEPSQPSPSPLGIINKQATVLATPFEFSQTIYRLGHSDTWACKDCKQTGDIHYMKVHNCSGVKQKR
jgi:hypothetical protein